MRATELRRRSGPSRERYRKGTVLDAWTNEAGRFDVRVPPGKYDVVFLPPPGFSIRDSQRSVELRDPRSCAVLNWSVRYDGRIRGVVQRPPGEAGATIRVELIAAEAVGKDGNIQVLRTSADAGGGFEFTEVPPGRYLVGVDLIRRMDPKVVFPTTFHPGTPDTTAATVVQLQGGEERELAPMTLPPARRAHQLDGTVVFGDGSPAVGAIIALSDGNAAFRQVAVGIKTGPDGTFRFLVHEGLSYIAHAWTNVDGRQVA